MNSRRAFITAAASGAAATLLATSAAATPRAAHRVAVEKSDGERRDGKRLQVAMLMYPGMTLLDFVGPLHFLSGLPGAQVHLVANQPTLAPVSSDNHVALLPTVTMADCPEAVDVLFMPGGTVGTVAAARSAETLEFVRRASRRARFVTSVCTGSIILGAAGLLRGRRATSHWSVVPQLERFGATPVRERVVRDGSVITAAGVSAGLDLGVVLADELVGRDIAEAMVLAAEYAPKPLLTGGTPDTARPEVRSWLEHTLGEFVAQVQAIPVAKEGA